MACRLIGRGSGVSSNGDNMSDVYTLGDSQREAVILVFLAWLATEWEIELCWHHSLDGWQPLDRNRPHDLASEFIKWQKNQSSS